MLKFLIDECLSPELAQLARDRGYHESFHVSWLGKAGWKDWELKELILEQDWTFVTRNSVDFRFGNIHTKRANCVLPVEAPVIRAVPLDPDADIVHYLLSVPRFVCLVTE
jgi:Domain of unknown function (DUF5615)